MVNRMVRGGLVILMATAAMSCSKGGDGGGGGGGTGTGGGTGAKAGGGGTGAKAATRAATFTLYWRADTQEPPGGVRVTASVPTSWKEETGPMGPKFAVDGLGGPGGPSLVLIHATGTDDATRMSWAINQQYDEKSLGEAKREDKPDGRVWIVHTKGSGMIHARMFVPAPKVEGVVMCVLMLMADQADRLAELQPFCESVQLAEN